MNRWRVLAGILVLATSLHGLEGAAPSSGVGTLDQSNAANAVIPVRLAKALDSKKAKPGDEVVSTTAVALRVSDGTLISSGSKVLGHVTEAAAGSKGDAESSLGVVFDRIQIAGGKELKIRGTLQAVAPPLEVDTGAAGSGTIPQFGNDGGTMAQGTGMGPTATRDPGPRLNAQSRGVIGFRNMEMGVGSLLTSSGKEIKLNSGTQMMVKVQFEQQ